MDSDRWQRIADLFASVLEREPGDRSAFLAHVAAGDDELRREVESLLAHAGGPVLIDRPMLEAAAAVFDAADGLAFAARVGADRATGGMSTGWDARRFSLMTSADLGATSTLPVLRRRIGKRLAIGATLNARYVVRSVSAKAEWASCTKSRTRSKRVRRSP